MPLYQYRCEACGHDLEVLQKVNDPPLAQCPQCGEDRLRKQLTAAGFRLKGSGWYETDFKGKTPRKEADKEPAADKKKAESKTDKSPSSKGKPEAKTSGGNASQAGASGG